MISEAVWNEDHTEVGWCKCQYKIAQKVENKNVQFIPLNPHSGFRETLVFP